MDEKNGFDVIKKGKATLGLLAVGDIAAIFFRFVALMFFAAFLNEMKTNAPAVAATMERVFDIMTFGVFVLASVLGFCKNKQLRAEYLNRTAGREYKMSSDAAVLAKTALPTIAVAAAIFALPIYVIIAVFGEVNYLTTLFMPLYCLYTATGSIALSIALAVVVPTAALYLVCLFAHAVWQKGRLRK